METLVTDRLLLRAPSAEDRPFVVEGMNDLSVVGWLSLPPYPYAPSDFDDFLGEIVRPGETWTIVESDTFCGIISLRQCKLGYWLLPQRQGRGIMSEAATAVLAAHTLRKGGPVTAGYFEGNTTSARVLEKLGFAEVSRETLWCGPLRQARSHVSLRLDVPGGAFPVPSPV